MAQTLLHLLGKDIIRSMTISQRRFRVCPLQKEIPDRPDIHQERSKSKARETKIVKLRREIKNHGVLNFRQVAAGNPVFDRRFHHVANFCARNYTETSAI